jgi:hypothetical protein
MRLRERKGDNAGAGKGMKKEKGSLCRDNISAWL